LPSLCHALEIGDAGDDMGVKSCPLLTSVHLPQCFDILEGMGRGIWGREERFGFLRLESVLIGGKSSGQFFLEN